MSLIDEIRSDLLDRKPLNTTLRKALVLAHKLKSAELKSWVDAELNGYRRGGETPDYRRFATQSVGTIQNISLVARGIPLPTLHLDEDLRALLNNVEVRGGVRELESLLESGQDKFELPWQPDLIRLYNMKPVLNGVCIQASRVLPRTAIESILDTVGTRLLSFILEIEDNEPSAGNVPALEKIPSEVTRRLFTRIIMNEHYHGPVNRIEGNQGCNIATDQARISSSTAIYERKEEVVRAVESLRSQMDSVAEPKRSEVDDAISFLAQAIQTEDAPKAKIVLAAETISNSSDVMKKGLRDICLGTSGSLIATGVWEGVKYALGY